MSEFEDRENDPGLNELPDGIAFEREENKDYVKEGTRHNRMGFSAPLDITQQNAIRGLPGEMGSVPMRFMVTSTYDARPVNARDFLHTEKVNFNFGCAAVFTNSADFIVPDGYVGVVRGFKWMLTTVPIMPASGSLNVTLKSDGIAVQNYTDMALGTVQNDFIPCYALSNSLKIIALEITFPPGTGGGVGGTIEELDAYIEIYGNLLLAKGDPIQYEPANRIL